MVLVAFAFGMKLRLDAPGVNVILVIVVAVQTVPLPVTDHVPEPIFKVLVPVPEMLTTVTAMLLLLALKSKMQPAVDAVHAPIVSELMFKLALTVMVQVTPPTHEFASKVTASADVGAADPGAPPDVVDQIRVLELSHVQVVVQATRKRAAALALKVDSHRNRQHKIKRFMALVPISHDPQVALQPT